jgi:hypothetical protein
MKNLAALSAVIISRVSLFSADLEYFKVLVLIDIDRKSGKTNEAIVIASSSTILPSGLMRTFISTARTHSSRSIVSPF